MISVTRRTLTRALLRDRSISFCRLRTFFRSPACDAAKIRRLSRRTFSSAWPQSTESQPGPPSGPFTCTVSNLPLGDGVLASSLRRLTRPASALFRAGQPPYPASYAGTAGGRASTRFPVSCCLSATGIRFSGLPAPAGEFGFPRRSAYRHGISRRTSRGCHVPHVIDATGVGVLGTPGTVVRSRPAKYLRPDPPPSSGRPLFSRLLQPTSESANDEASSRIHSRSPVRSSPACGLPGWNGSPWAFPRAPHPAVTRSARRGGDGPCALDRELRHRHQSISLQRAPLITCDLVSHCLV